MNAGCGLAKVLVANPADRRCFQSISGLRGLQAVIEGSWRSFDTIKTYEKVLSIERDFRKPGDSR
jgi:hypothetical protein